MLDDPFAGLKGSSRGRWWIDDGADEAYAKRVAKGASPGGMYRHMFVEDLTHLFPFRSNGNEAFRVALNPTDADVHELILDALPTHYGRARTLEEGLRDFGEMGVFELVDGPLVIEVEFFSDADGNPARAFRLNLLPNVTMWRSRRGLRQWVPNDASPHRFGQLHFVDLDPDCMVVVDLPRSARRIMKRSLEAFGAVDALHQASVDLTTAQPPVRGFDVRAHRERSDSFARRASRDLGWDGRGLVMDGMAEPYVVWRRLRFARFRSIVLEAILRGLQEALIVAGERLGFVAAVELDGVLTSHALDAVEREFQTGSRSLMEISRELLGLA